MSWDEAFSRHYAEWSAHITADIAFYVELARQANGPVVELAVGSGRVAVPVAQATGRPVIGIDSSPAMLEQARCFAANAGVVLDLREGDMRDLALDQPAALIYCPFRALLHLPSWADRRRTFERVASSLVEGDGSPGMPSPSTTTSQPAMTAATRSIPFPTPFATRLATTESTSPSTMAGRAHRGGRPKTNGSGSSTSPASSRRSMAASVANRSTTTAESTCSSPAADPQPPAWAPTPRRGQNSDPLSPFNTCPNITSCRQPNVSLNAGCVTTY